MNYNVQDHGDYLEKEATQLIRNHFPYYEKVWSIYIGNQGNESIASLPNYPYEKERKHFAENSYTVLESFFIIHNILESKIFEEAIIDFSTYIEFNKAFITVFALLGRIHDTVIKASDILNYDNTKFKNSIKNFYEARNIVIHGKKVPLIFDDLDILKIPFFKTEIVDGNAWDDKHFVWNDIEVMNTEYAVDKLNEFFKQLIQLVNNEYAIFYDLIIKELKTNETAIKFINNSISYEQPKINFNVSGITSITAADIYGFRKISKKIENKNR
jgi:hypothetical protein